MTTQNKLTAAMAILRANKPLRLLLIALGLAALATFMAIKYLELREAQLRMAYQQPSKRMVKVVVSSRDLPSGAVVNSANMSLRSIPESYVHSQAISPSQFSRIEGRRLIEPIKAGRALLWTHVSGIARQDFSDILNKGRRAVTITVDELSSNAGMLQPGNKIDLYVTMSSKYVGGTGGDVVFPLLQNVEVLATGTSLEPKVQASMSVAYARDGRGYSNITINLTAKESALLLAAKSAGRLSAVLRNRADAELANFSHVQPSDILSLAQQVAAEATPPPKVVRDKNGKIVGVLRSDGKVVDNRGNVIGQQTADGKIVDAQGNQLGSVNKVVTDANGNVIGTVQEDGSVIDATGKVIGKQTADGTVVSESGEVIGKVADEPISDEDAKSFGLPSKKARQANFASRTRFIDFLSGGNSKNGVATVEKITVQ